MADGVRIGPANAAAPRNFLQLVNRFESSVGVGVRIGFRVLCVRVGNMVQLILRIRVIMKGRTVREGQLLNERNR